MTKVPAKRLGAYYFLYFCAVGALMPYLGLFMLDRGCTPAQVGTVNAILAAMRIATPYFWGTLADRSHRRMQMIQWALLAATAGVGAMWLAPGYWWIVACLVLYGFFINGTLAQFEVVTFRHLGDRHADFSKIRLWASAGYVVAVLSMGWMFEVVAISTMPLWVAGFYLLCWGGGHRIPEPPEVAHVDEQGNMMKVLRRRPVQALLAVGFLWAVAYAPFGAFFSIYLEEHGYSKAMIGFLWALAVSSEVVLFRFVPRLQARIGVRRLMLWGLGVFAARWVLQAWWVDYLPLLMLVQVTQAISVGVVYITSVALVQQMFPSRLQGRGQAIYTGLSNGVGTALGSLATGALWIRIPTDWLWSAASTIGVVAWLIAWRWLHPEEITRRKAPATVDTVAPEAGLP